MQKFEDTVITDNGLNLLATINDGDDKIQYTKAVLAADDFTQVSSTEIQKITGLTIKMSSPISINSRINDTINLSAFFTNETITEDFDFYCIGWYAKGIKDPTEYLIAISPSTVKQTMPAGSNNAATASISPKYAMALSQNAEVEITTNPAGSVTKDQLDKAINDLFGKSIINDGTSMTGSQDLNSIYGTYLGNINGDDKPQNVPSGFGTGQFISYGDGESTHPITQLIYDDVNNVSYFRSYDPAKNKWTDWDLIITKSQLNAVLPTDIARTGEDNDFKGKNTFETDPVNKNGDSYGLAKDIATKVTDNGDNSIEINKQAVTPVRDNKNGSINFNSKDMTPADDSKVVHDNHDNTITANSLTYDLSKSGLTSLQHFASGSFNDLPLGTVFTINSVTGGPDKSHAFTTTTFYSPQYTGRIAQIAIADNTNLMFLRTFVADGAGWNSWTKLADDSKVAHLSGANNFDTVPTVNNNPLLLASSLPSDLARTGQDQEFTGKNIFDIAPIDKTTGNPYITAKAPGIPKLAVTYNTTSKAFEYALTAPEKDGLSDIIQYNLLWKDHSVDDWTTVIVKPDALTGQLTGVDITKTYDFKAAAQNAVGSSGFTDVITLPAVDGNIYGVSWDGSSSGALQRTDAAVGLKAGINGAQNDFDTRGPWGLMDKTVTDSYGNAFVRVPKFYIRKTQDKNKPLSTWQVSLVKQGDDWYLPNCFYDFDTKKELDYVDVSRYEGFIESGHLKSKSGVNPTSSVDINDFRTAATALNAGGKNGYHLWDVHTLDALQVLFTIEFATLDSQSIMKGVTDNILAGAESTGAADSVKGSSGNVDHSNGYGSMTYRGIENLYGNLGAWTDGLNISNLSLYSCDDATKYASDVFTSPYYMLNYSLQSMTSGNLNITGLGFDKDHPSVEAPTSSNNDQYNTYYHDYYYVNGSGNYVVYTGGGWSWDAGLSGLWYWYGADSSTGADSGIGSRLLKKAL